MHESEIEFQIKNLQIKIYVSFYCQPSHLNSKSNLFEWADNIFENEQKRK